jgi:hypothetical protein
MAALALLGKPVRNVFACVIMARDFVLAAEADGNRSRRNRNSARRRPGGCTATHSVSSLRMQGPPRERLRSSRRRGLCFDRRCPTAFAQQLPPVMMGPCFRRDDIGGGDSSPDVANGSARSATRWRNPGNCVVRIPDFASAPSGLQLHLPAFAGTTIITQTSAAAPAPAGGRVRCWARAAAGRAIPTWPERRR